MSTRERRKEQYRKYLNSNHWRTFKDKTYSKYDKCFYCGKRTILNIHHLTYKRRGREEDRDVIVLCKLHHFMYHRGLIPQKDVEFMLGKNQRQKSMRYQRFTEADLDEYSDKKFIRALNKARKKNLWKQRNASRKRRPTTAVAPH